LIIIIIIITIIIIIVVVVVFLSVLKVNEDLHRLQSIGLQQGFVV